ncbi:MAG TPA: VWA domain-containing protein, partial [Vicinamibacteria bacterium]|nr:VWA domain-containing protein [Vicinamibacteria bacterium]
MRPRRLLFGLMGLAVFLAATNGSRHSWAQNASAPTFPSGTELITVDAVVVDNKGSPVIGLTKDDFLLQEDGQPQEIANFEVISLPGPGEGPVTAPAPTPPSPPRIATSARSAARGTTFLVVVDDIHLTSSEAAQARTTLERFLRVSVNDGDRTTIVTTGNGAAWNGALPEDRDDLLAFVRGVQGRNTGPATPLMTEYEALRIAVYNDALFLRRVIGRYHNQGACAAPPSPCDALVRGDAQTNQAHSQGLREASLSAIDRAVAGLAQLPGRKAVLLLSEGFIHDDAPEDPYHHVVIAAQRANAAIYFIDVGGLRALPASASAEAARDVGLNPPQGAEAGEAREKAMGALNPRLNPPRQAFESEALQEATDTKDLVAHERFTREVTVGVETMADETGGFIVRNTNDLAGWLNRISTESRSYYLLGYHPTGAKAGFRKIDLKVKRPGVHVRARRGYYATGTGAKGAQPLGSASGTVAGGSAPHNEVPLRLAIYTLEPGAEQKTRVVAVTEIDVSGLASAESEGQRPAQLDVRLEAIPRDGGTGQGRRLSIEAEPPRGAETPATGLWRPLRLDLALPPGVYQVRATVADTASGRSGAASQRIVVPDPSAFHLSTPILSAVANPAPEGGGQPVPTPVAHDRFSSAEGQQLFCAFQVFGAAKDASSGHYDVSHRFVLRNREGQTLAAPDPRPLAFSTSGQSQQVLVLPLAKLRADDYKLTLTVEDRVAGKKEELVVPFTAEDAPVAARATPPP